MLEGVGGWVGRGLVGGGAGWWGGQGGIATRLVLEDLLEELQGLVHPVDRLVLEEDLKVKYGIGC